MQIFVRERMKILSKSKVAQVFLFFFSPPLWLNTLSLLALWFLSYFFPEKSHRLVESKTVKGMFATRHRNTCPHSLPIAHQTHRPVDGCKPGWRLGRLNSIRSATHTIPDSLFTCFSQSHKRTALFSWPFLLPTNAARWQQRHHKVAFLPVVPAPLWRTVVLWRYIFFFFAALQPQLFHWMTEHSPCNFPLPPSFPRVLALHQICLCAILITAKAIFMVVFCENTNLQKRW